MVTRISEYASIALSFANVLAYSCRLQVIKLERPLKAQHKDPVLNALLAAPLGNM